MDRLWATVVDVVDGDTFDVSITHEQADNDYEYDDVERARLRVGDAPELPSRPGVAAQRRLDQKLVGRRVELEVHARDVYGRLIVDALL